MLQQYYSGCTATTVAASATPTAPRVLEPVVALVATVFAAGTRSRGPVTHYYYYDYGKHHHNNNYDNSYECESYKLSTAPTVTTARVFARGSTTTFLLFGDVVAEL